MCMKFDWMLLEQLFTWKYRFGERKQEFLISKVHTTKKTPICLRFENHEKMRAEIATVYIIFGWFGTELSK